MIRTLTKPVATVLLWAVVMSAPATMKKCGESQSVKRSVAILKSSLAAAPALVNSLMISGVISETMAQGDIRDFTRAGLIATVLGQDIALIDGDAPDAPALYSRAAKKAADGWRAIIGERTARGARTHPKVEQAFAIADGVFLFVEAFLSDQAGEVPHEGGPAVDGLSQSEFEKELSTRVNELKRVIDGR